MRYVVSLFLFLFSFLLNAAEKQEVKVIKALVGQTILLPTIPSRALSPTSYTINNEPDKTIIKRGKDVWNHENGYTTRLLQYCAVKKGTTYLHLSLHSNINPSLGIKWFIIEVK